MSQREIKLDDLIRELKVFVELSFQEDEISIEEWLKETVSSVEGNCWIKKQCNNIECPAYKNECGRCWLIAGTLCGGTPCGSFVEKYGSCIDCDVYQDVIGDDKVTQLK